MSKLCTRRSTLLIGLCLAISSAGVPPVYGVSLQTMINGAVLTIGNARFDNWALVSMDATSGVLPNLTQVEVVPLGSDLLNPGVQFLGNSQFATTGLNALELEIQYRVSALLGGNSFVGHSLSMTGLDIGGSGGIANIAQEAVNPFGNDLGPAVAFANAHDDEFQFNSVVNFATQAEFIVTTNIFITGLNNPDTMNLTSFSQRFVQTGAAVLPGDYNDDGNVNAADYALWRDRHGAAAGSLPNDVNGGPIGQPHYDTWKAQFGATSGSGAGQVAAVPEPAGLVLALFGAGWLFLRLFFPDTFSSLMRLKR